jgi:hypothetical protein
MRSPMPAFAYASPCRFHLLNICTNVSAYSSYRMTFALTKIVFSPNRSTILVPVFSSKSAIVTLHCRSSRRSTAPRPIPDADMLELISLGSSQIEKGRFRTRGKANYKPPPVTRATGKEECSEPLMDDIFAARSDVVSGCDK